MEKLPLEITDNILFRLPVVSQLHCRELCKTWEAILPKPKKGLLYGVSRRNKAIEFYFSEATSDKVDNTTKLDHSFKMPVCESFMVGSCNGLVCYAGYKKLKTNQYGTEVHVCNPVSGEHIKLPTIKMESMDALSPSTAIGFGYIPSSKKYKVVCIQCRHYDQDRKEAQVYTLQGGGGGTGWRYASSSIFIKGQMSQLLNDFSSAGVFTGGVVHWLDESNILGFDLKHERFELLPSIPTHDICDSNAAKGGFELMELGRNLCVLLSVPAPSRRIIVWELMKPKIGKSTTYWVKKFTIAWEGYSRFVPSNCACNVILSCFDPETRSLRNLKETLKQFMDDEAGVYTTARATPHVNSLVSLKGFTEKRGGKKRKAHEEPEKEKIVAST